VADAAALDVDVEVLLDDEAPALVNGDGAVKKDDLLGCRSGQSADDESQDQEKAGKERGGRGERTVSLAGPPEQVQGHHLREEFQYPLGYC
jgi:hypothetical protein